LQVRDFHIAQQEEDVGYYAGFVGVSDLLSYRYLYAILSEFDLSRVAWFFYSEGSAFMLGRALTSVFWGTIADRYGRKPVMIFGAAAVFVTSSFHFIFAPVGRKGLTLYAEVIGSTAQKMPTNK